MGNVVNALATGVVRNNQTGEVVSICLIDQNGTEMTVPKDAVYNAISNGTINVINMTFESNNEVSVNDEMQKLVDKLNEAVNAYYNEDTEIMSNYEYDELYDKLVDLEKKTGIRLKNTPTRTVGPVVDGALPKEKHEAPMLSLDKTKEVPELASFLGDKHGVLSWKMDGLTVVLTYDNGRLIKAVTRGDGEIGEVVTENVKQFVNVPVTIPFKGKLILRGEAITKYSDFNRINASLPAGTKQYENPRNLTSGSVRQRDSYVTSTRKVNWYCFQLVMIDGVEIKTVTDSFALLSNLGFSCVDYYEVTRDNVAEVVELMKSEMADNEIPSDGLVITYDDIAYGLSLGRTAKFPRHSLAFKWQDECVETTLKDIEWSASRTGLINPVAIFEPVRIEGSTVARASVHNVSILKQLKLGYGDRITVYKANMIIPQLQENLDATGTCEIPDVCPVCGQPTSIHTDYKSGVETLYCENLNCPAKLIKRFEHYVSRDAMNINGISEATLETLVDLGIIKNLVDLYHMDEHMERIISTEGFGLTSYENMIASVNKSRTVKLENLIYALGIPMVGLATARLICRYFNEELPDIVYAGYNELIAIDGVGDAIATEFSDYFADGDNTRELMELIQELDLVSNSVSENQSLSGYTVCITGGVEEFENRDHFKRVVDSMGGKVTGSVSAKTNILVTNDTTSGSAKNIKAQELGIPIMTELEFIEKFGIELSHEYDA